MKTKFLALALVLAAPFASAAEDGNRFSYTYGQAGIALVDAVDLETGFALEGSFAVSDMFYVWASGTSFDFYDELRAGGGVHFAVQDRFDVFAELGFISVDSGFGADDGITIGVGGRYALTDQFELYGVFERADFGSAVGADSDPSVGAVFQVDERFKLYGEAVLDDGADVYEFGVRIDF